MHFRRSCQNSMRLQAHTKAIASKTHLKSEPIMKLTIAIQV